MHRRTIYNQILTASDYIQLKAFARVDGALLSLLWIASFCCYIIGLTHQWASLIALFMILMSPFYVAKRLRIFRDTIREGVISFMRSWLYVVLVFLYGSLLFSLAVFAYFQFLDHGYVLHVLQQMMETPEMTEVLKQYQMEDAMSQMMMEISSVRPIDIAFNFLITNMFMGMFLGLTIAAIQYSNERNNKKV